MSALKMYCAQNSVTLGIKNSEEYLSSLLLTAQHPAHITMHMSSQIMQDPIVDLLSPHGYKSVMLVGKIVWLCTAAAPLGREA